MKEDHNDSFQHVMIKVITLSKMLKLIYSSNRLRLIYL